MLDANICSVGLTPGVEYSVTVSAVNGVSSQVVSQAFEGLEETTDSELEDHSHMHAPMSSSSSTTVVAVIVAIFILLFITVLIFIL